MEYVNKNTKYFFLRIFILAFCWKMIYRYILRPVRFPDKLLTNLVTIGTVHLTNFLHFLQFKVGWMIHPNNSPTANGITKNGIFFFIIDDTCNGLEIMMIYIGILLLIPNKSLIRTITFILSGLFMLIIANMVRCTALLWLYESHRLYFEINHHYVFTFLMYGIIISGWLLFLKKQPSNEVK